MGEKQTWRVAKLNLRQSSQIIFYNYLLAISSQEVNQLKSEREEHAHTQHRHIRTCVCVLNNTN